MSVGPEPRQQPNWDWRAAANFVCGGAGGGLVVFAVLAGLSWWPVAAGAALLGAGLSAVWLEIGRPWRALNVFFNPRTSWMTREAIVATWLFAAVAAAAVAAWAAWAAAALAVAFVWCQGRILRAARGIPTWREPRVVPLVVATGLAEGGGLFVAWTAATGSAPGWVLAAFAAALLARFALWHAWRTRLRAAPGALAVVDAAGRRFRAATLLALVAAGAAAALPAGSVAAAALQAIAGLLAVAGGAWFKFTLVTRAAFTQGFALPHLPVRGVPRG